MHRYLCLFLLNMLAVSALCLAKESDDDSFQLTLRQQQPIEEGSDRFHRLTESESWAAEETAVIVCDMWDSHHCYRAVKRVEEMAPRMNTFLKEARSRGAIIIHAPSGCLDAYADHPARARADGEPKLSKLPEEINQWCYSIPSEEAGTYPIDQSDGGEDDTPEEHAAWEKVLRSQGRNPDAPWLKQIDAIDIDAERDFISDKGDEIWSILANRGIDNVMLVGVHTNMCVLGRPFGLRQMARNGKNVVLVRDLTDTMYNPAAKPFVSHFTGTDLIIDHIERHVCPTITSDQLLGRTRFVFSADQRPHVVFVIAEDEYQTAETLPDFALAQLGKSYKTSFVFADPENRNRIPGLEALKEADLAVISVRRRTLPESDLAIVRDYVDSGKPVVGLRTASHAFSLRNAEPPEGLSAWPEFDAEVFGGNYTNHYGNNVSSTITIAKSAEGHPILPPGELFPFQQAGSLYKVSPLAAGTTPLLIGTIEGETPEPVAWTFERSDGGRSFYSSLGHPGDFENDAFVQLLKRAVDWAVKQQPATTGG